MQVYKALFQVSLGKNSKMGNIVMAVCIGLSYTRRRKKSRKKEKKEKPFLLKMLEIEFHYHHIYKQNIVEEIYAT